MHYYLDTEFNGWEGQLLSLALIREDGHYVYLVYPLPAKNKTEPWVKDNVLPRVYSVPKGVIAHEVRDHVEAATRIKDLMNGDEKPIVVSDWPKDVVHFCDIMADRDSLRIPKPVISFTVARLAGASIAAAGLTIDGLVKHNAWWDAMLLRYAMTRQTNFPALNRPEDLKD